MERTGNGGNHDPDECDGQKPGGHFRCEFLHRLDPETSHLRADIHGDKNEGNRKKGLQNLINKSRIHSFSPNHEGFLLRTLRRIESVGLLIFSLMTLVEGTIVSVL